ncbi:hypothetical protein [Streptomyces sp. NPDC057557]|uniref:hypothetical protein n=1 Tax=Streptomyces sp. NPDC057557 TaxID=3346167 RepID=UPI00367B671B
MKDVSDLALHGPRGNGFAELKNRLRGAGFILRSKAPELVCQEICALLTVCQALCALQMRTAGHGGTGPDRISFTVTVQAARLAVAAQAAAEPHHTERRSSPGHHRALGRPPSTPPQQAVPTRQRVVQEHLRGQKAGPAPHSQ